MFWLSFCDPDAPEGEQFLGGALVDAADEFSAVVLAHRLGVNPGGEVMMVNITGAPVPEEYVGRLLSRREIDELDDIMDIELN